MISKRTVKNLLWVRMFSLALGGCSTAAKTKGVQAATTAAPIAMKQKIDQKPVPLKITRNGTDVFVEMTAQVTNIKI